MVPRPIVSNGRPGDQKMTLPNLKALRAVDPQQWPYVRSHTGKWSETKAMLANLPAHGGARRGMALAKKRPAAAKAKQAHRKTQHRASAERPRSMAAQPKAMKAFKVPGAWQRSCGWRLTQAPSFLISLAADVDRRHAAMRELKAIGFACTQTVFGVDGAQCIKALDTSGQYCTAHLNKKGFELVGQRKVEVRCKAAHRAAHVFGCTQSHLKAMAGKTSGGYRAGSFSKATQQLSGGYRAFFEDDIQLTLPGPAIDYVVSELMRKAQVLPDIIMLGGKDYFGSFDKAAPAGTKKTKKFATLKAPPLATLKAFGSTWAMQTTPNLLEAHAYLLSAAVVPAVSELLQEGYAADCALAKASRMPTFCMAAFYKDGALTQLVQQRPKAATKRPRHAKSHAKRPRLAA